MLSISLPGSPFVPNPVPDINLDILNPDPNQSMEQYLYQLEKSTKEQERKQNIEKQSKLLTLSLNVEEHDASLLKIRDNPCRQRRLSSRTPKFIPILELNDEAHVGDKSRDSPSSSESDASYP